MTKTSWLVIIVGLIIVVGALIAWTASPGTPTASDKNIPVSEQRAVLYFSTTMDQDLLGNGKSTAVFLDNSGESSVVEMKGLELGDVVSHKGEVMIHDKSSVYFYGEEQTKLDRDDTQHTGDRAGYLEGTSEYYTVFNSGMDGANGYRSDIYWGTADGMKQGVLPYYIEASGQVGDALYTIHAGADDRSYELTRVTLTNQVETETIMKWEKPEGEFDTFFSQLNGNEEALHYARLEPDGLTVTMQTIDLTEKKKNAAPLARYETAQKAYEATPFSYKDSAYMKDDRFYFIDGTGDVYADGEKQFTLSDSVKQSTHKEVAHTADGLYVFSADASSQQAQIERYEAESGEIIETIDASSVFSAIEPYFDDATLHLYDVKIIE